LVIVDPDTELEFLHALPVALMRGVGPATEARLAKIGVTTIGQLVKSSPKSVERLLGHAVGRKLTALAWNRDPRQIQTRRRARSAGAQSALGRQPAIERVFKPTLHHLADRIGARLCAKSLAGRTFTVRVRFADLRSVTRSLTLSAPISATRALAEIAEDLVRGVLAAHRDEKTISLLAIAVSSLEAHAIVQLELPLGLGDEGRRPGTKKGLARSRADGPSMRSASASEERRSIMGQQYGVAAPSLTSFDGLLKESCEDRQRLLQHLRFGAICRRKLEVIPALDYGREQRPRHRKQRRRQDGTV
jgi:DNA polymerase-4